MWGIAGYGEELGFYPKAVGKGLRVLNKGMSIHIMFKMISLSASGLVNR